MLHLHLINEAPLPHRAAALALWRSMRKSLGRDVRAALLLPHELHVLVAPDSNRPRRRIASVCASLRHAGRGRIPTHPRAITRPASRAVIPGKRGLVAHPLHWEFSSWRDAAGLVCRPWVTAEGPARVQPVGRARHRRPTFADLLRAVCAATRSHPEELGTSPMVRRMAIQAAAHQGWDHPELLAGVLKLRTASVRRALRMRPDEDLDAVLRCLRVPTADQLPKPGPSWSILQRCSWAS